MPIWSSRTCRPNVQPHDTQSVRHNPSNVSPMRRNLSKITNHPLEIP